MVVTSYVTTIILGLACLSLVMLGSDAIVLALGGLVLGITILWSLRPRREEFKSPGVLLDRGKNPRLFAELDSIASSLQEKTPDAVYLIVVANAWVTEVRHKLGSRPERILAIGLPLLGSLTVAQFRAILAHEFAHYYGGDTRLGPWVYKARNTMVRTFQSLGEPSALLQAVARVSVIALLYRLVVFLLSAYWKLFLRCTQLVSRKQEFRADELASRVAGSQPLIEGLSIVNRIAPGVEMYWNTEVAPIALAGFYAPLAEGFALFVAAPGISSAINDNFEKQLREEKTHAYDSHPPLRDRIARASEYPAKAGNALPDCESAPAFTLFDDLQRAEIELLHLLLPSQPNRPLQSVPWESGKATVVVAAWKSRIEQFASVLRPIHVSDLPAACQNPTWVASHMPDPPGMLLTRQQRNSRALDLFGVALGTILLQDGWTLVAKPGVYHVERGNETIQPIQLVHELAAGTITPDAWTQRVRELGIADRTLAPPDIPTTQAPPNPSA
jgi:Zn-dependent protease with chaperone function